MVSRRSVWRGASPGKPDRGTICRQSAKVPIVDLRNPRSCYRPRNRMNSAGSFLASVEGICMTKQGVGARLLRKEDDRLMRGRGQFVADIRLAGLQDVAFVRSPLAHARIRGISIPPQYKDSVFTAADLDGVKPIRAVSGLPGFKISEQPVLATGKVRQVGELVAMCVAPTRAEAEDIAAAVDARSRGAAGRPRHAARRASRARRWCTSTGATTSFSKPSSRSTSQTALDAPIKVTREISTARQCMSPIEGRGVVATCDHRARPAHALYRAPRCRTSCAPACPNASASSRAASASSRPTSAAASATRASCCRRKSASRWLAMRCGHPVRWIEDRREHLTASANCREHHYSITVYADRDGRLRGIDCEATVDSGAYSSYPFSACLEAAQVASILPGPYDLPAYRCRTFSVATNKCPILPYRGVARTGVCFALETDARCGRARSRARARRGAACAIWCGRSRCRSTTSPTSISTAATIREALRRALAAIDVAGVRARQQQGRAGRAADRRRPLDLLRAGRARHLGLCRLGHSDGARLRAGHRAADAGRRARTARRRAFARPGPGNDAGAGRARNPRHRYRQDRASCIGDTAHDALFDRHLGLALHGDGGRRGRRRACQRARRSASQRSARSCCRPTPTAVQLRDGERRRRRRQRHARARSRAPGTCAPQDLPPDVDPRRPGGHRRLQAAARHRHLQLCRACRGGRGRSRDSARSRSSTTSSSRTAACWSIRWSSTARSMAASRRASAPRSTRRCRSTRTGQPLASTLRRLSAAGADRSARRRASITWRRRRPTPSSASRASARAAPSRRRPRSSMPSTTRCGRSASNCCTRRSRRAASSRRSLRARATRETAGRA